VHPPLRNAAHSQAGEATGTGSLPVSFPSDKKSGPIEQGECNFYKQFFGCEHEGIKAVGVQSSHLQPEGNLQKD